VGPALAGTPPGPVLLRAVDRAAFAVALGQRLREAGVPVTFTALGALTRALHVLPAVDVRTLYWTARVTLVHRGHDLRAFDAVFSAVFEEAALAVEGHSAGPSGVAESFASVQPAGQAHAGTGSDADVPWHTLARPAEDAADPTLDDGPSVPELLPSAFEAVGDTPFDELDEDQLALVGSWIEQSWHRWPTRRSRRRRIHHAGRQVELRETMAASRRTAWEPVELSRSRPVRRPRTVTMVADVSQSMQPYTTAYLHLMRALARSRRAETFAFSTALTRLTPALRHRSVEVAVAEATELVVDRFGGTHLAASLRSLLRSRHGNALRGGVLVIASDGWDSDDPEDLAKVLLRLHRRVHRLVWLNPRAGAAGFEPLVGSMAAALPVCDEFLPAHTLRAMTAALDAILAPRAGS
jgi:uncharacterized protein with von Willebrand factor type A (vWA) domain